MAAGAAKNRARRNATFVREIERRSATMRKKYNTPHRSWVIKTRMTDEEYAEFCRSQV